jgi:dimethylargininase
LREIDAIREALSELGLEVVTATDLAGPDARVDGGDVCVSRGGDIFVGLSQRSNAAGVRAVEAAFARPGCAVHGIPVHGALHLKSLMTSPRRGLFVVPDSDAGAAVRQAVCAASPAAAAMTWIAVPDAAAANVLFVNGTLLVPAGMPKSTALLARASGLPLREVANTEGAKVDGALSCCSLLVSDDDG